MPATRNAREEVKSAIWLIIGVSTLSPLPRMYTGFCGKSLARSAEVRISAPPPSVTRQHISSRNGVGDHAGVEHVATVIGSFIIARGFFPAHSRWTTATIASCSSVTP